MGGLFLIRKPRRSGVWFTRLPKKPLLPILSISIKPHPAMFSGMFVHTVWSDWGHLPQALSAPDG
ncbi:hypothetical protein GGQ85_004458 [Nitrobacter vulgaris]|nr:hypothetical protein [Nitrobacter vulgaris]